MVSLPDWPKISLWKKPRRTNLDAMLHILEQLDNPHQKLPPVIHVAGTNGKGSTIAMLASIFQKAGYKTDCYTSPHMLEFNERININGRPVSDAHLDDILTRTRLACKKIGIEPSFFEGTTAAAFLAFSESKSDILLLETGLGGRLDCTNVIEKPLATIITSISKDHTEVLGDNILQIASEKAGIIKKDVPCIIGRTIILL